MIKLGNSRLELLNREIEMLREELNRQADITDPRALAISRKLDQLIIQAIKLNDNFNKT